MSDNGKTVSANELAGVLLETPCVECGRSVFTFERNSRGGSFECPVCRKRTLVVNEGGKTTIISEGRLVELVRHIQKRRWYCPDHAGVELEIGPVQMSADNPLEAQVPYVCRRGGGIFGKKRVHNGSMRLILTSLEGEMLAGR